MSNPLLIRNIRRLIERHGNQHKLAAAVGVEQASVSRWLKGSRPNETAMRKLAGLAGVSVSTLQYGSDAGALVVGVPLLGYVGAGETWMPIDDYSLGAAVEHVPHPPGKEGKDLVALRIKGDSMRPLRNGWLVYYKRDQQGIDQSAINQLSVVMTAKGEGYVKELRRGRKPGLYSLYSWTYGVDPIEDIEIDWAAPVEAIIPA